MRLSLLEVPNQQEALKRLATLARNGTLDPVVTIAARQITDRCDSRDDRCELQSIYDAVKHGTDAVPGLERGVRYVADPRMADHFVSPGRLLRMCRDGACGEDCDSHAALVSSLAGSVGFKAGVRAYGPPRRKDKDFTHVYAVAMYPKKPPYQGYVALDTTVPEADVGWEPPGGGNVLTVWF